MSGFNDIGLLSPKALQRFRQNAGLLASHVVTDALSRFLRFSIQRRNGKEKECWRLQDCEFSLPQIRDRSSGDANASPLLQSVQRPCPQQNEDSWAEAR